jgi:hypothetical protein
MFKSNYKAFIATEIFAIIAFVISMGIIIGITVAIFALSPNLAVADLIPNESNDFTEIHIIWGILAALLYLTLTGFLFGQFGLAYDIYSSGDMFTEFKKSFTYFKTHWWKYVLLTFVSGFGFFRPNQRLLRNAPLPPEEHIQAVSLVMLVVRFIVVFVLLVVFSSTLPSVTAQGNLKRSFIESIRIVKRNFSRLFKTWGVYFLIFSLPIFASNLTLLILIPSIKGTVIVPILLGITALLYGFSLFIGIPMMSLIATRIYNTVEFERFKPLPQKEITKDKNKNETNE